MNKKTISALIAGVEKWERNALAKTPDDAEIWDDTCKLCHLFIMDDCKGCPVRASTGENYCEGSPWDRAAKALTEWEFHAGCRNARARFRRAAKAEANFLRSLIPATEVLPQ